MPIINWSYNRPQVLKKYQFAKAAVKNHVKPH